MTNASLLAFLTRIWFLSTVRSDMPLKGRKMHEAFSTLGAFIEFYSSRNILAEIKMGKLAAHFSMLISFITFTESACHRISQMSCMVSMLIFNAMVFAIFF